MSNFGLFICGIVVSLIAGMGILTSTVFYGYNCGFSKKQEKLVP
jgi:hypothetical protein